jgi:glutathione S-transferase
MAEQNEIFLYWGSGSTPCWRIQIALDEKNLDYGNKLLSFDKQDHKSEEIVKLNPRGQVLFIFINNFSINSKIFMHFLFSYQLLNWVMWS